MFNLTREERQVLLFLVSIALLGVGINFLAKRYAVIKSVVCPNQDLAKINLNRADKITLVSVPGIGEKLAQRIIEYRNKHHGFLLLEELKNIKGISTSKFEKIRDYLYVD